MSQTRGDFAASPNSRVKKDSSQCSTLLRHGVSDKPPRLGRNKLGIVSRDLESSRPPNRRCFQGARTDSMSFLASVFNPFVGQNRLRHNGAAIGGDAWLLSVVMICECACGLSKQSKFERLDQQLSNLRLSQCWPYICFHSNMVEI